MSEAFEFPSKKARGLPRSPVLHGLSEQNLGSRVEEGEIGHTKFNLEMLGWLPHQPSKNRKVL